MPPNDAVIITLRIMILGPPSDSEFGRRRGTTVQCTFQPRYLIRSIRLVPHKSCLNEIGEDRGKCRVCASANFFHAARNLASEFLPPWQREKVLTKNSVGLKIS